MNLNFWLCVLIAIVGGVAHGGVKEGHPTAREVARAFLWAGIIGAVLILTSVPLPWLR